MDAKLLAPCNLYCGVCGIYIAHRDNNAKFKERLAMVYGLTPDQIACDGCLSNEPFVYCRVCPIKSCNQERGYESCHQCNDFPCEHIDNFIMPVGRQVMLRATPLRREHGTEKWVAMEIERYHCPSCGEATFRGAKRCRSCKTQIDLD